MTKFEYVSVLIALVVSLALARLLTGIATMIHRGVKRFSLPLVMWIGYLLFLCVDFWFSIWGLHDDSSFGLGYVAFMLLMTAVLYVSTYLIVPEGSGEPLDLVEFYDDNRRKFLSGIILYFVLAIAFNLTVPEFTSRQLTAIMVLLVSLAAIAWIWNNRVVQLLAIISIYVTATYYAIRFIPEL